MRYIALLLLLTAGTSALSQDRAFLRQQIEKWGECKNVALTETGGDVALYGKNGYAFTGATPSGLKNKIKELREKGTLIDDIVITESGSWLVLFGDNGAAWEGIPSGLENKIREFNRKKYVITSISFNDYGDWLIVSHEYMAYSAWIGSLIERGKQYGDLWAGHITHQRSVVLVFAEGYVYEGNVPTRLRRALEESNLNVYRVKFLEDGTYFFADEEGNYRYYM